jgi:predicted enzyme related to lactoylglutathione lyase
VNVPTLPPSSFSWLTLSTSDVNAAGDFYGQLFGWTVMEGPAGSILTTLGGLPVGSLVEHRRADFARKEPVNWLPFVSVTDMTDACSKVEQLGGTVWVPAFDVGVAQVAIIRGASGEALGLWNAGSMAGLTSDRTTCAWFELATREPEKAIQFYKNLLRWRIAEEGGYRFIGDVTGQFGGIVELAGDWEDWAFMQAIGRVKGEKLEVPPHWMVFFGVEDCDVTVERAEDLGAQIMTHPEPLHTVGTMAVLRDPQGVYFSVLSKR